MHQDVSIVGTCDTVAKANEVIISESPDLLLLDIALPDGTAFDLLASLDRISFRGIFITAYEQYAIQALKVPVVVEYSVNLGSRKRTTFPEVEQRGW